MVKLQYLTKRRAYIVTRNAVVIGLVRLSGRLPFRGIVELV